MAVWYCGSTKWTAVTAWAASTAYNVGDLRRQLATPTVGNERVFRCTTAGTSGGTEPTWTITKGGTTNDGTAVWTEVTGNSTYGWNAPAARIGMLATWVAAGDTVYVSNNHAETQSTALSWASFPGLATSPNYIVCVDDGATPPTTRATTATVAQTGNASMDIGSTTTTAASPKALYIYGIGFTCGNGTSQGSAIINIGTNSNNTAGHSAITLESCSLFINSTNATSYIQVNSTYSGITAANRVTLINTTLRRAGTSQIVVANLRGALDLIGCSLHASSGLPASGIFANGGTGINTSPITMRGCDWTNISTTPLLDFTQGAGTLVLVDCKLPASAALTTGTPIGMGGQRITVICSDSADTVYRYYQQTYCGTEQHETTVVRTGGASDGATTVSRKIVTTANSKLLWPYESMPLEFWNTNLSAQTITIPVLTDNVTLTDADAWIEVEYLGTSGNPLGVIVSGRMSDPIFGTTANHATDSTSTWTTTGLGTPVKQKLVSPSFTAQKQGLIRVWVKVARSSTTLYYDPKALSTSGRQYMSEAGVVNEGASSSGSGVSRARVVNC